MRELELHTAKTPEDKAFIEGKHLGKDQARREVVLLLAFMLFVSTAISRFW